MKPIMNLALSRLRTDSVTSLDLVENGEQVTITRHGREVARLI